MIFHCLVAIKQKQIITSPNVVIAN